MAKKYRAIGLMSGTSLDGVDVAYIETDGQSEVTPLGFIYQPYTNTFQEKLSVLAREDVPLNALLKIERELTDFHVEGVEKLIKKLNINKQDIDIIGFHGQTIRHLPDEGLTWQIGDNTYLAEKTGLPVVSDFRRRDMAAGGEGAPLAPLFHQALLNQSPRPVGILNIGGVSNLTWLGEGDNILAGDIGPGCGLMDSWAVKYLGKAYDEDGKMAAQGRADMPRIEKFLDSHTFFNKPFPKSADRYDFDSFPTQGLGPGDGAATLLMLTVEAVKRTLEKMPAPVKELYICGGGAKNPTLMGALGSLAPVVKPFDEGGFTVEALEAQCFGWLAVRRLLNLPTSLPATTGASKATVGGLLSAPSQGK